MSREILIPERTVIEEIINATHYSNDSVHFSVGVGKIKKDKFELRPNQTMESFVLRDTLYTDLIDTYGQGFTNDDLWHYVDLIRAGAEDTSPGANWDWNTTTNMWVKNKKRATATQLKDIDALRLKKDLQPIAYDSKVLDADETARRNILGKLAEISAANALNLSVDSLVWRDADNVTHVFDTLPSYKAWLQGLVCAISARATNLYLTAWMHKENVKALTVFEEIEAYNIKTGW
jgi:hypothetical protein